MNQESWSIDNLHNWLYRLLTNSHSNILFIFRYVFGYLNFIKSDRISMTICRVKTVLLITIDNQIFQYELHWIIPTLFLECDFPALTHTWETEILYNAHDNRIDGMMKKKGNCLRRNKSKMCGDNFCRRLAESLNNPPTHIRWRIYLFVIRHFYLKRFIKIQT